MAGKMKLIMGHMRRWFGLLLPIVMATTMTAVSALWLMSSINGVQSDVLMIQWQKTGTGLSGQRIQYVERMSHKADKLAPFPVYRHKERIGELSEWRAYINASDQAMVQEHYALALKAYKIAAEIKPFWPYAWRNIAHAKYVLRQHDEEFMAALGSIVKTSPWRRSEQIFVANTIAMSWPMLDHESKSAALQILGELMELNANLNSGAVKAVRESQYHHALCIYLTARSIQRGHICDVTR